MPWTAATIRKHNHALKGAKAKQAAKVANAILAKTGDEGRALAIANAQAKKSPAHKLYPSKEKP
jgi:uncharacterized protein YdaT